MGGSATTDDTSSGIYAADEVEYFALVAYLPEPLAGFLSELRNLLDPRFRGKPHLTLLPPRPLACTSQEAWAEVRQEIRKTHVFRVDLGNVETFAESQVVFLSITSGTGEIKHLHERLNAGVTGCFEVWKYHPHITLAHGLFDGGFDAAAKLAQRRWSQFQGPHEFEVKSLVWVKTTIRPGTSMRGTRSMVATDSQWVDLEGQDLIA